jgi:hypothetical protein
LLNVLSPFPVGAINRMMEGNLKAVLLCVLCRFQCRNSVRRVRTSSHRQTGFFSQATQRFVQFTVGALAFPGLSCSSTGLDIRAEEKRVGLNL